MLVTFPSIFNDPFALGDSYDRAFAAFLPSYRTIDRSAGFPYVNLAEYKDEIQIVAELPGIAKEDIKLQLHDGTLTISGERKAPQQSKDAELIRQEIWYGTFSRTIELPDEVDGEKISAEHRDGILRVILPKAEAAKPKEITIR